MPSPSSHLIHGDCLDELKAMPDASVDAIVTDPPYGLSFMGKKWDYDVPSEEIWAECLRVLKPGGHLLAFAGTRTQHRMAIKIEDAGFEIRDLVMWHYGSGFPKSLDISKALDKAAGVERTVIGLHPNPAGNKAGGNSLNMSAVGMPDSAMITAPVTDEAKRWEGWGTALKPATEIITMARKPFKGTVAANVLQWGTGGINVDGCRVEGEPSPSVERRTHAAPNASTGATGWETPARPASYNEQRPGESIGRWPANLLHNGSDEVVVQLGSAARFFYCSKTSKRERGEGNNHPTVKPLSLMRYLCRLVTPPGGTVLDPFMGSGTTGIAAAEEGFGFIGIEKEQAYYEISQRRIATIANDGG